MAQKTIAMVLSAAALSMFAPGASAIDIYPADYTVLPAGVNLGLMYTGYSHSNSFKLDGVGKVPDSSLGTTIVIPRLLHYDTIGSMPVAYQAFLPFGWLSDAKVGGQPLQTNNGAGDLTLGFTAFPVHTSDPAYGTTVGLTMYVSLPTGKYDLGKAGPGAGTVTYQPQLGIIQGLGNGLFIDGALDVSIQSSHDESGVRVKQSASTQLQAYLRYQLSQATALSFGYSGTYGGRLSLNDVDTGQKTRTDELRLYATQFLTPTWQLGGTLAAGLDSEGGFKRDYAVQLRLVKVF
jgi:hypothetical protein